MSRRPDRIGVHPQIGSVLPAMGYGEEQLHELEATINATECDVVVTGTRMNLTRLIDIRHPVRHATYAHADHGHPRLRRRSCPSSRPIRNTLLVAAGVDDYAS